MSTKTLKPSISDQAVEAKTGKAWREWFSLLDKAGGKKLDHKALVAILNETFNLGPWWRQMVTVEYERSRGLREIHETADGFVASISKTYALAVEPLFEAWKNTKLRNLWLEEKGVVIRSIRPLKTIRLAWSGDASRVEVQFTPRGPGKTQICVQHSRLDGAAAVVKMKTRWNAALGRLKTHLEASVP